MSYRKYDIWSKELADGRMVEFTYGTLFQTGRRTKSWAGTKISGIALDPILNVASGLPRSEIEALFEKLMASSQETE
jgi:hypothetical protein